MNSLPESGLSQARSFCGADMISEINLQRESRVTDEEVERGYRAHMQSEQRLATTTGTIPVVFHIIHNNGPENISDQNVEAAVDHLNQAFSNTGPYARDTGFDTGIQFCLAQRDENGSAFSGVTRHVSPYTDFSLPGALTAIRDLAMFDRDQYFNIFIVENVCAGTECDVAGIGGAYTAVIQADYLGVSVRRDKVIIHEMGHALGLAHTWKGGCKNTDCLSDGDKVCDTPPDNRTYDFCFDDYNSCTSDEDDPSLNNPYRALSLGGLGDQPDDQSNYMDYNPYECIDHFSQGQASRMQYLMTQWYPSLLASKVCLPPCEDVVIADFTLPESIEVGSTLTLTHQSVNAESYQWSVNGVLSGSTPEFTYTFDDLGDQEIALGAFTTDTLCLSDFQSHSIAVYCPVEVCYTSDLLSDQTLDLENCSIDFQSLQWVVYDHFGDTLLLSNEENESVYINNIPFVEVCLSVNNDYCQDLTCEVITLLQDGSEICGNEEDDDGDGLIDLFDPECPCEDAAYQAQCPQECEVVPDPSSEIKMKMKWESEVTSVNTAFPLVLDNNTILSRKATIIGYSPTLGWPIYNSELVQFDGKTGQTISTRDFDYNVSNRISTYREKNSGILSTFFIQNDSLHRIRNGVVDGSVYIQNSSFSRPNLADFNSDGIVEVVVGTTLVNAENMKVLAIGNSGRGCQGNQWNDCTNTLTVVGDFLPNPGLELAAGNTVYQFQINSITDLSLNLVINTEAEGVGFDGVTSYGDFDQDGYLDVVVLREESHPLGGGLYIWSPVTKQVLAATSSYIRGFAPHVSDLDNDCAPEIIVTYRDKLVVYKFNGTDLIELYDKVIEDSGNANVTTFDFMQDGYKEIVHRDEEYLRIIDGISGHTIDSTLMKSATEREYPIITDIDSDGQAEILISGYQIDEENSKLYCFESAAAPWAPARSVWNQYAYNPTQVNDDLTIPRYVQNPAQPLQGTKHCERETCNTPYNNFMVQATYRTQEGCYVWPDESCNDEICGNEEDDDGDGLIDLFDPDCPCEDAAYQAQCPQECELVPDAFPEIKMKVKWESERLNIEFGFTSNNIIVDMDGDGTSEILNSYSRGVTGDVSNYIAYLNGSNGLIKDTFNINPFSTNTFETTLSPAVSRLTTASNVHTYIRNNGHLISFDQIGTEVFRSLIDQSIGSFSNPSISDFNADNIPDVFLGDVIFNGVTGDIIFVGRNRDCSINGSCRLFEPIAADVLGNDNIPELITGRYVYELALTNLSGTTGNTAKITEAPIGIDDGRCAVSDMDGDGQLDIIVVTPNYSPDNFRGALSIWNPRTGTTLSQVANPPLDGFDFGGGMPVVGDVDGDCIPEVGVVYEQILRMFKYSPGVGLELLYDIPTTDGSGFTGVTMFDFNQDGKQELVYRDETSLRVFEGATGEVIDSFQLFSGTGSEYPLIADVDNDGEAEIIVSGSVISQNEVRMYCFESAAAPWAPARSVWNQYAYNPTQVNDDLTIPRYVQNPAQPLQGTEHCERETCNTPYNNFMVQATYRTQEGCYVWPELSRDLTVTANSRCIGDSLEICFYGNTTDTINSDNPVDVSYYPPPWDNNQGQVITAIETVTLTADTTCLLIPMPESVDSLMLVINDGGGVYPPAFPNTGLTECDYTNNEFVLTLEAPDFVIDVYDFDCSPDSLTFHIAIDNIGDYTDIGCIGGACYLTEPIGFDQATPMELTTWCFDFDTVSSIYVQQDTFSVTIPLPLGVSEIWWTVNDSGFGPSFLDSASSGIFECDYSNNVSVAAFDVSAQVLDLGPDLITCMNEVISLTVGGNFESYVWSDLSIDSVYSSSLSGLHFVEAKDYCGRVYRDTVEVTIEQSLILSLGPDLVLCESEEVSIIADGVFDSIDWFPSETVDCDDCLSVTVLSDTTTMLIARAEMENCIVSDTLYLSRIQPELDTITRQGCAGDTIAFFGGQYITESGIYDEISLDCEMKTTMIADFVNSDVVDRSEVLCSGDSLYFDGNWIKSTGIYTHDTLNVFGCDSLSVLDLTVNELLSNSLQIQLCAGDTLFYEDLTLTEGGTYTTQKENTLSCDSIITIDLELLQAIEKMDTVSACLGDSLLVFDLWIKSDTLLSRVFNATNFCDSTQYLLATFYESPYTVEEYSICSGDTLFYDGELFTEAGNYLIENATQFDCDSTIEVSLEVLDKYFTLDTISLCEGDTVSVFGDIVTEGGVYSNASTAINGCDSLSNVEVLLTPYEILTDTLSFCFGDSISIFDTWIKETTTLYDTIQGSVCNEILEVTILEKPELVSLSDTIVCFGSTLVVHDSIITQTGIYEHTISTQSGCDSTSIVNVEVVDIPTISYGEVDCESQSIEIYVVSDGSWIQSWSNGDTGSSTTYFLGETGEVNLESSSCSSEIILDIPNQNDTQNLPQLSDTLVMSGALLNFDLSLDNGQWSFNWSPSSLVNCDSCSSVVIQPLVSQEVSLVLTHTNGCQYFNEFVISVEEEPSLFIPNIFMPNSGDENSNWVVTHADPTMVVSCSVFDRWGNQVFSGEGARLSWDGTFNGEFVEQGVYLYILNYVDSSGSQKQEVGDITLLR